MSRPLRAALLALATVGLAGTVLAQAFDPLTGGVIAAPQPSAPSGQAAPAPLGAGAGPREYPIRTPLPANVVNVPTGVIAPSGMVALATNMPGHRRFRPPLWPDAGWDSPSYENGVKNYDAYLVRYWRAPFLAEGVLDPAYVGREQPGYIAPGPYPARVARSRATPAEVALFERRMQFIVEEIKKARPLQDLHGASLEPVLTVAGYGEQYGATGDGVMHADIELRLRTIAPNVGKVERMPNGRLRSDYFGPGITLTLNPYFLGCAGPVHATATSVDCIQSDMRVVMSPPAPRLTLSDSGKIYAALPEGIYPDARPATDIRILKVAFDRKSNAESEVATGRLHPHDSLGRVIGVVGLIDWPDLLARANAVD